MAVWSPFFDILVSGCARGGQCTALSEGHEGWCLCGADSVAGHDDSQLMGAMKILPRALWSCKTLNTYKL